MSSLLPEALQDKHNLAIEECIKEAFSIDMTDLMTYPIENNKEENLFFLADEYHVLGCEGWNLCQTKQQKINLVSNALKLHAKKGSLPSVIKALESIGIEARIKQFYEFEDNCPEARPAHFSIEFINIFDRSLTPELESAVKELIMCYKPATRHLDKINYCLCAKGFIFHFTRFQTLEKTVVGTKGVIL